MAGRGGKYTSDVTLGWRVNGDLEPAYWLAPNAKPGRHPPTEVVTTPAEVMAYHTIIVAQSGSGKSFFLGRLIEEILLHSKARVLVFDPNSDFRKIHQIVGSAKWDCPRYDPIKKDGHLPSESTRRTFKRNWDKVSKVIYSVDGDTSGPVQPVEIDWLNFSIDWFADDADPAFQSELRHCHNFINAIRGAMGSKPYAWRKNKELLDFSQSLLATTQNLKSADVFIELKKALGNSPKYDRDLAHAAKYRPLIGNGAERFYFGMAQEALQSRIFGTVTPPPKLSPPARLHVVDLPSIINPLVRKMAIGNFLDLEWTRARAFWATALTRKVDRRKPLFIVLDEAHNIIPSQPSQLAQRRLTEWFRTIAAEGRKFGIFLILVTQRPDKIDPLVISECENKAILKISSEAVLKETAKLLGLSSVQKSEAKKALSFWRGRALLCGPWAGTHHTFLYTAMRRTEEGGRNLNARYWARPE
jgi:hypothetical protein